MITFRPGHNRRMLMLLFSAVILTLLAVQEVHPQSNWDRAVEVFGTNRDLKPLRMEIQSKTFNGKGVLEKYEQQLYLLSYGPEGEINGRVLESAYEDGTDVTRKRQKELEKSNQASSGNSGPPDGMDKNPLDPDFQKDVTAVYTGRTGYKNGTDCEIWDFTIKLNDKYKGNGTAWLNRENGEAVALEYRIEPLFPFVEEMTASMDFKSEDGRWFLYRIRMHGVINMIITKKSFNAVTIFTEHRSITAGGRI